MVKSISNLNKNDINEIFDMKINNYDKVLNLYLSSDEKEIIIKKFADRLNDIISKYISARENIPKIDKKELAKDLKMLNDYRNIVNDIKEKEAVVYGLINDESKFLDLLTLNDAGDFGLTYTDGNGKKLYVGINDAIKKSIITNTEFYIKTLPKDEYEEKYKESSKFFSSSEVIMTSEASLYQIKDRIVFDMYNILGDDFYKFYLMGNASEFNKRLEVIFSEKNKFSEEDNIKKEIYDFSDGIDKSIYKNDESYYTRYIYEEKGLENISKNIDIDFSKDLNKGLK